MACDETTKTIHVVLPPDDDEDDDYYYDSEYYDIEKRMSRLIIESSDGGDADAEVSDDDEGNPKKSRSDSDIGGGSLAVSPSWMKEYASETDQVSAAAGKKKKWSWGRRLKERWLEKTWEMKKSKAVEGGSEGECRLLVRTGSDVDDNPRRISMDLDEVKACRDLGLELPSDWTVEIPSGISGVDTSSGGNSPIANWRISSPGDDPEEVKARLKVWAQAVALTSATRLTLSS